MSRLRNWKKRLWKVVANEGVFTEMSRYDGGYEIVRKTIVAQGILLDGLDALYEYYFKAPYLTIDRWRSFQCIRGETLPKEVK